MSRDGTWEKTASGVLAGLLGGEGWEAVAAPLREHDALDRPVITVFGAYDSGKSTLIKRILVDESAPIPDWLTISARRETFEAQSVDLGWARLRDTPGLAGGNAEHETIAREALLLSDAVLLVLPPQLLTGERETIVGLLRGARLDSKMELQLPGNALYVAVARMDEAGTDPAENPSGYEDLCGRKLTELRGQLERERVAFDESQLFCVVADPYQQVGNRSDVRAGEYDEFRAWDGMGRLREGLAGVRKDLPQLREQSRIRYLAALLSSSLADQAARRSELEQASDEARNGQERFALIRKQHEGLMAAARAELDAVVSDQLRSSALANAGSAAEVVRLLEPRMNKAFELWHAKHGAALAKLARDAGAELEARGKRPGARSFMGAVDGREDPPAKPSKGRSADIGKIASSLRKALRLHHERRLGMTLAKAEAELKKLKGFSTFEAYREAVKGRNVLRSTEHVSQARRAVNLHNSLEILSPVLLELGGLLFEELARREAVKERAARREQLQRQIQAAAASIASEFWKDFEEQGAVFGQWIRDQQTPLDEALAALQAENATVVENVKTLERLLLHAPGARPRATEVGSTA